MNLLLHARAINTSPGNAVSLRTCIIQRYCLLAQHGTTDEGWTAHTQRDGEQSLLPFPHMKTHMSVPVCLLLLLSQQPGDVSRYFTMVGIAASFISTFFAHGFLTLARQAIWQVRLGPMTASHITLF